MKSKRVSLILCVCAATLLLPGCGNAQKRETNTDKKQDFGTTADKIEISADELLDSFIDGEVMAYYVRADSPFYITDLPSDPEDFTCYSVGDRVDLDNDGENELILKGPYGGKYLDARDGQVYVLDEGGGTASQISYTEFDDQTWIVHADITHAGRNFYYFTLYDGAGHVLEERSLLKEYWETPDLPDGPATVYTYGDKRITREEYDELKLKMLGE